jgi:hypothetical protein
MRLVIVSVLPARRPIKNPPVVERANAAGQDLESTTS